MEPYDENTFTGRGELYESFAASDTYGTPFERATSEEWAECEAIPVEYACPVAQNLIDRMNDRWTPRDLHELADALRAHTGSECVMCGSTRKTVVSDRLYLGRLDAVCCGEVA